MRMRERLNASLAHKTGTHAQGIQDEQERDDIRPMSACREDENVT